MLLLSALIIIVSITVCATLKPEKDIINLYTLEWVQVHALIRITIMFDGIPLGFPQVMHEGDILVPIVWVDVHIDRCVGDIYIHVSMLSFIMCHHSGHGQTIP